MVICTGLMWFVRRLEAITAHMGTALHLTSL